MNARRPRDRYGRPLPAGSPDRLRREASTPGSSERSARRGAELFDARRFFEAHECFEALWNRCRSEDTDRAFWKGLTQIAVGCCHVQRGNTLGALALLERGARRLEGFPSPHLAVDTTRLIESARSLARRVGRRGASPDLAFPRFPRTAG